MIRLELHTFALIEKMEMGVDYGRNKRDLLWYL